MVVKGRTKVPLAVTKERIGRKSELKLLGVTFNEDPCNWDTHFEQMLEKASSRLYILRICKYYGYSLQELAILFESLIVSLFKYAIEVWACAYYNKYLFQIDRFCKRAVRYGYTNKVMHITELIRIRDRQFWEKLSIDKNHPLNDLLPPQRKRVLRKRGHNYILPSVKTERFKRCIINRCLFNFIT